MPETPLGRAAAARAEAAVDDALALIAVESPSDDLAALARSADAVRALVRARLDAPMETVAVDGRPHLRTRWGAGDRVLVLAHHDTVWPLGTVDRLPAEVRDGALRGPGGLDMKGGIAVAVHALAAVREVHGDAALDGVTLLVTADEEVGSLTSRALIEDEARRCSAVLVLEAAADGGQLKGERKGVGIYRLSVEGRAAHAGLEPDKGVNATVALAHLVLAIAELGDPGLGTTVTPTLAASGTSVNTVPAGAAVSVDVRARTHAELSRVDAAIRALDPGVAGAVVTVDGGINRPPLDTPMSEPLLAVAREVAAAHGLATPVAVAVGGASDGNLTAGVGTPTLDGLGLYGGGAHAEHEHARLDSVAPRLVLLAGLVERLGRDA